MSGRRLRGGKSHSILPKAISVAKSTDSYVRVYGEALLDVLYREVIGFINKFILWPESQAVPVTASDIFGSHTYF